MWFYLRIYVDYQLVEVYIERYWKQSAAAWTFVMADNKGQACCQQNERIKPYKTHMKICPWSKNHTPITILTTYVSAFEKMLKSLFPHARWIVRLGDD